MLDNIKSIYFIRIIFSFIDEGRKLGIIKYNKKLKNSININLINYKLFSGRYIIYEEKGKGKEYDYKGNLIYEGEFKNGKRNGKGEEYYSTKKLIFNGEYLNGKRWNGKGFCNIGNYMYVLENGNGFVKEITDNFYRQKNLKGSKIIFEGQYLNGKKNGKGKEYTINKDLIFEGEYLNGKRWNGKIYLKNNEYFEIKNGKGYVKEYISKYIFEGEYLYGDRFGKGKELDKIHLKYEGEYLNGKRHGEGKEYYDNGKLKFVGEYYCDFKLKGKIYYEKSTSEKNNGVYSIHELINDNEKIKEYYSNNKLKYEIEYLNEDLNGKGKEYYSNGLIKFEGEYFNGKKWKGIGKTFFKDSTLKSEINYIYGKIEKEKEYNKNGELIFEGKYLNRKRWNGKGKEYNFLGQLEFEGEYINGKKYYSKNGLKYFM